MPGHLEPQQLPPTVPLNQEGKQEVKAQRRHNAQIDGGNGLSVISKKRLPGLRRRLEGRVMYFETVDWATSNPSIKSSPWIRDAPHSGFSWLIR